MTRATPTSGHPLEHGPREGETIVLLHGANVAGWMWEPQIELLPDRHLLTPDLPGYGARADTVWPDLGAAADLVADLIRTRALEGRAHLVGLSLGGHVAIHVIHRHPDLVHSCTVTGVAAAGLGRLERSLVVLQLPLWRRRWYWAAQAVAFGIPADARELFVDSGSRVQAETNRRVFSEVAAGTVPAGAFDYAGPVLAVSGEREPRSVRAGFEALGVSIPQLQAWVAPRMHHIWNIEDPALFARMIVTHADTGTWPP
ncbi:alpha/beta fold hydrolase [Mumia zhuanghuii]|uniref:Alpha/beta fold hydrolase n=2 Tax=Mumia TaxID=1546255 RepID=A0ABW1QQ43_9ACTN|nr:MULTISPECIES: alpha/beta hydrolase [Mumia]KAA1425082.1 alpha/beta fold hydrolase [Mumia zhuanghuii]